MKKLTTAAMAALAAIFVAQNPALAGPGGVPQASITLLDSAMALCHHNDTAWTLEKTGEYTQVGNVAGVGAVTWTVTVTKGATTPNTLSVFGYITIKNTGSAGATIGNIVVNLQKRTYVGNNQYWISAAADCADAFSGDLATSAHILAAASLEDPNKNVTLGANNYTVSGQEGTFVEGTGSGSLSFINTSDNSIFSLNPQVTIAPGDSISLKYTAEFNNTILQIPAGNPVKMEIIVSFGNAGERGGSGASACNQNIDINGNLSTDADELCIRSVPQRVSLEVPTLEECNKTVTLTDTKDDDLTTSGTVTVTGYASEIDDADFGGSELLTDSAVRLIVATVTGGITGGTVCNAAHLTGESTSIQVGAVSFQCCQGVKLDDSACVHVPGGTPPPPPPFGDGEYCTYTQGGWGNKQQAGNNVGTLLADNFYTVYPPVGSGQVEVGIPGAGGFSMIFKKAQTQVWIPDHGNNPNQGHYEPIEWQPWQFISRYLPDGGPSGIFDSDLTNPDSTSAHQLAAQTLALKLNVDFSGPVKPAGLGALIFQATGTLLDGHTVAELLADCNLVLGGGTSAYGLDPEQLKSWADGVNNAFDNCQVKGGIGGFANTYLTKP